MRIVLLISFDIWVDFKIGLEKSSYWWNFLITKVRPNSSSCPYRTVLYPFPFSFFLAYRFFTAIATFTVPFFSLMVRSVKPYRTKSRTVIRLLFKTASRTAPKGLPSSRTVPHQFSTVRGHPFGAVGFTVLNTKALTLPIFGLTLPCVRSCSRSNTKKLLTVRQKNSTVTVALAVKNGTLKKWKTVRTRYDTVRYGTDTVAVTYSDALLYF